jgi:predicted nuclease of restriction endonuclease-like RecB superfamily
VAGQEVVVDFLAADDQPWLRSLLEEFHRYTGRCERELRSRLTEPLPLLAPLPKRRAAAAVLWRLWRRQTKSAVSPRQAREVVFRDAARLTALGVPSARTDTLSRAARALAITPAELDQALFADVPGERILVSPREPPGPAELGLRTNLALAQYLVMRSSSVRISAEGNIRALVRLAKLRGLICTVHEAPSGGPPVLELSGPLSIFRRTLLYGRALAEMVPLLGWCPRFHFEASCVFRRRPATFVLSTGAPVFPSREPRHFDSRLEARFARDFARLTTEWDLVREPEPVRAGGALIFPDFLLRNRSQPDRRFLLEIVGFWTRDYLESKLSSLRKAALTNLILCIDEERNCAESEMPVGATVVRFRRHIDPAAVLAVIERHPDCPAPELAANRKGRGQEPR